jgi:hypothetical protein
LRPFLMKADIAAFIRRIFIPYSSLFRGMEESVSASGRSWSLQVIVLVLELEMAAEQRKRTFRQIAGRLFVVAPSSSRRTSSRTS